LQKRKSLFFLRRFIIGERVQSQSSRNRALLCCLFIPFPSFHPAIQKFKALVDSGTIGKLKGSETELGVPSIFFAKDDIRFKYSLGGGATMDMGG
jgi:hypothetical protein